VFGANYVNDFPDTKEKGAWRIEVSPRQPNEHDAFLNVMQVKDIDGPAALQTEKVETESLVGAKIKDWIVLFSKSGAKLQEELAVPLFSSSGTQKCIITDLQAGDWTVVMGGSREKIKVAEESGVLHLAGITGSFLLIPHL
jgi:hypothetical protein